MTREVRVRVTGKNCARKGRSVCQTEETLWLVSINGDKKSYGEYSATIYVKIIIWFNKVPTIDIRNRSVGSR